MTSPKDAYENFFQQLMSFLELIAKFKNQPIEKWPEGFEEKLAYLEGMTEIMFRVHAGNVQLSGLQQEQFKKAADSLEGLPDWGKRFMERMKKLRSEIEVSQREAVAAAAVMKQRQKLVGKKPGQARKKRFRRMGGRDDWKPL